MNLNCITGNKDKNNHLKYRLQESLEKAKSIDIIVSFLMESGVKLIREELESLKYKDVSIRILTGNYLNITQPSALYLIKEILGEKVDLRFYNDKSRSFHPKAYIFEYDNGGEIFIGSSNLSNSALTSGIEWNYRIDKSTSYNDFKYFKEMFDDLFLNESEIITDDILNDYSKSWTRPKVNIYKENKEGNLNNLYDNNVSNIFEPRGAQIEALYNLRKNREDGNDKGLVVAATGIGKTYLAAFDSREFNKVLFVAHREEILKQAYESFKNVRLDKKIKSYNKDLMVAENCKDFNLSQANTENEYNMGFFMNLDKDTDKDIIFASVQSLGKNEYLNEEYFSRDYFDYIVVDEFHHAVSSNYKNIMSYFTPKFMLGITATPERLDNKDVFAECDYNVVYEVNLKSAINKGWLVPFRYYGIYDDSVNYEKLEFKNGKYNSKELEEALNIKTRADLVLNHYRKYKSNRALGFCTSKSHAEYMAKYFSENGISSCAVYSGVQGEYSIGRKEALEKLRNQEIKVIFSVDMFNEGLDVKSIDMVMFLRPTESPIVFLQQLGRGLRKDKNKKYLNVLDFIGNYKKANLVPYLLSSKAKDIIKSKGHSILDEEDYPEDCLVDFDFRLIDLFERMDKENKKIENLIVDEYFKVKEELGHIPTRLDMFIYMDSNIYDNMKKKSSLNIFKDYLSFLDKMGEITSDEKEFINTKGHEFIKTLEATGMQKSYKMHILLAFYNHGDIKLKVDNDDLFKSFMEFYAKGSNKVDLLKEDKLKNFREWTKDKYSKSPPRNQPINALTKSNSDFFIKEEGYVSLNDNLKSVINNDSFKNHFKDVIDFRTKEFYKNRYDEKSK